MTSKPVKRPKNPLRYAVWLLERKQRSEADMRLALARKSIEGEEAETIIAQLRDWGYLDDQRYKHHLIDSRQRQNVKGRTYVRQELMRSGIDDIDDLEELYSDEAEQAVIARLLQRWMQSSKPLTREQCLRRLASRGFTSRNVFAVLGEMEEE